MKHPNFNDQATAAQRESARAAACFFANRRVNAEAKKRRLAELRSAWLYDGTKSGSRRYGRGAWVQAHHGLTDDQLIAAYSH